MLSQSNIKALTSVLERKNGLSGSIDNNIISLGRPSTDIFIENDTVIEGPLTGISSLFISGVSTLQGATTNLSSLNVSGNTILQGATTVSSSLNVSGITTINNTLNAQEVKQQYQTSPVAFALLVPTGSVITFASSSAPLGWLLCDGSAVSRTTYASLFALIGETYGVGDGVNTFNVPNLKGRVVVGFDSSQTEFDSMGKTGGAKTHTLSVNEMPGHNHEIRYPTELISPSGGGDEIDTSAPGGINGGNSTVQIPESTEYTGGGDPHNNLQPYMVLNYIIKY